MSQIPARQVSAYQPDHRDKAEVDIELLGLMRYFVVRWKLFVICILAAALLMAGCTVFLMEPQYEAVSKMYVVGSDGDAARLSDMQLGTYLAADYQEIFYTHEVTDTVIRQLDLDDTYEQMQERLRIVNPSGTRVLYIRFTHPDPALAAAIADEYLRAAGQYAVDQLGLIRPADFSAAVIPDKPVSPHLTRNIVFGALAGSLLAAIYLFVRFLCNEKRGME